MYLAHFGLQKEPFHASPDPAMLYLTAGHRDALAAISYAILTGKGFAVLTGDAGTGKTTVLSRILQTMPATRALFSVISNSVLTPAEFLESVLLDFGIDDIPGSKALRLQKLHQLLLREHASGRVCVLVVDEAQKLSEEVVEEIRLLSNCELPDRKLLQIILSGQSELETLLERQALRQFKQRISVRLRIAPLSRAEAAEYIRFRWAKAGAAGPPPFNEAAVEAIAAYTKGIPRVINILCDNALLAAFGAAETTVSLAVIQEAAADLALFRANPAETRAPQNAGAAAVEPAAPLPAPPHSWEPMPTLRRYGAPAAVSWLPQWAARLVHPRQANGMI